MKTEITNIEVTTQELALLFNRADKYISELVKLQGMPKLDHNRFKLFDCLQWWIKYQLGIKNREIERIKNQEDPQKDLARKNIILKEIEIQKEAGDLVFYEDIKKLYLNQVQIFIKSLEGMPSKLAPQLKGRRDTREIISIIQDEIIALRNVIGANL